MAGRSVIDQWYAVQPEEVQSAFMDYCKKNYHKKENIFQYLVKNGCPITSLSTVYGWMKKNILPGEQAVLFNEENEQFVGVEMLPLLEKMSVKMSRIANHYVRVIEENFAEVTAGEAMNNLPGVVRELRSLIELSNKISTSIDERSLLLSGASRVMQIVMGSPNVRDQGEEAFFRKELEVALLQLKEEADALK